MGNLKSLSYFSSIQYELKIHRRAQNPVILSIVFLSQFFRCRSQGFQNNQRIENSIEKKTNKMDFEMTWIGQKSNHPYFDIKYGINGRKE